MNLTNEEKKLLYKKKIREGMTSGKAYKSVGHTMAKLKKVEEQDMKERKRLQKILRDSKKKMRRNNENQ